jgi:hypothetical protein
MTLAERGKEAMSEVLESWRPCWDYSRTSVTAGSSAPWVWVPQRSPLIQ